MSIGQQRYGCYVGNIDRTVTVEMLRQVFCQCGTILECSLNGRDEDPYRYGFIDFATEDDRARAMKYNGFTLVGRKLKVGMSKGTINRSDGSGRYANNNNGGGGGGGGGGGNMNAGMLGGGGGGVGAPAGGMGAAVVNPQQVEAQLLMQLIQQGSMDPRNLTPAQQQLLFNYLSPGGAGASLAPAPLAGAGAMGGVAMPGMLPPHMMMGGGGGGLVPPMPMAPGGMLAGAPPGVAPMMVGPPGMANGGFMPSGPTAAMTAPPTLRPLGVGGVSNPLPHRGPANPPPSEETVKLREVQRKQFLDVVRKEADRYERKVAERAAKEAAQRAATAVAATAPLAGAGGGAAVATPSAGGEQSTRNASATLSHSDNSSDSDSDGDDDGENGGGGGDGGGNSGGSNGKDDKLHASKLAKHEVTDDTQSSSGTVDPAHNAAAAAAAPVSAQAAHDDHADA